MQDFYRKLHAEKAADPAGRLQWKTIRASVVTTLAERALARWVVASFGLVVAGLRRKGGFVPAQWVLWGVQVPGIQNACEAPEVERSPRARRKEDPGTGTRSASTPRQGRHARGRWPGRSDGNWEGRQKHRGTRGKEAGKGTRQNVEGQRAPCSFGCQGLGASECQRSVLKQARRRRRNLKTACLRAPWSAVRRPWPNYVTGLERPVKPSMCSRPKRWRCLPCYRPWHFRSRRTTSRRCWSKSKRCRRSCRLPCQRRKNASSLRAQVRWRTNRRRSDNVARNRRRLLPESPAGQNLLDTLSCGKLCMVLGSDKSVNILRETKQDTDPDKLNLCTYT